MPDYIDIYHGSVNVVERPLFGAGKIHNDYGRGFYCKEDIPERCYAQSCRDDGLWRTEIWLPY